MTIHNRLINDRISMLLQESEQFKLEDRGNKFSKSIFDNGSLPQSHFQSIYRLRYRQELDHNRFRSQSSTSWMANKNYFYTYIF